LLEIFSDYLSAWSFIFPALCQVLLFFERRHYCNCANLYCIIVSIAATRYHTIACWVIVGIPAPSVWLSVCAANSQTTLLAQVQIAGISISRVRPVSWTSQGQCRQLHLATPESHAATSQRYFS